MEQIEHIKLVMQGDSRAFYDLISPHKAQMYKIAYSYFNNEQDALEAIQETTCKAYNSIHKLKHPEFFKTWLIRILINYCIDERKRKSKIVPVLQVAEIEGTDRLDNKLEVRQALQKIKPLFRSIIILKYFEGLTINEIAIVMEKPQGTIKTWLSKALNALRVELREEDTPYV